MLHADILQMNIKSLFSGEDSLQTCKGPFTQGEFLHSICAIVLIVGHMRTCQTDIFGRCAVKLKIVCILKRCTAEQCRFYNNGPVR